MRRIFRSILQDVVNGGNVNHNPGAPPSSSVNSGISSPFNPASSINSQPSGEGRAKGGIYFTQSGTSGVATESAGTSAQTDEKSFKCPIAEYIRIYNRFPEDWPWEHTVCQNFRGLRLSDLGQHLQDDHRFGYFQTNSPQTKKIRCRRCWFFVLDVGEYAQFHGGDTCPKRPQPRNDEAFSRECWQLLYRRLYPREHRFPKCCTYPMSLPSPHQQTNRDQDQDEVGFEDLRAYSPGQPSIPVYHASPQIRANAAFLGQSYIAVCV